MFYDEPIDSVCAKSKAIGTALLEQTLVKFSPEENF